jgi:hypothetical protein
MALGRLLIGPLFTVFALVLWFFRRCPIVVIVNMVRFTGNNSVFVWWILFTFFFDVDGTVTFVLLVFDFFRRNSNQSSRSPRPVMESLSTSLAHTDSGGIANGGWSL